MPQSLKNSSQNGRYSAKKLSSTPRDTFRNIRSAKAEVTGRGITTQVSTSTKSTSKF